MKKPREQDMIRPALQLLAYHGVRAWRNNSGAATAVSAAGKERFFRYGGEPGASDILGLVKRGPHRGRFFALELKMPGKKLTAKQKAFLDEIREDGGIGICASSLDQLNRLLAEELNH